MVSSVTESRTHLSFEIDDLTGGIISVKRWLDQDVCSCILGIVFRNCAFGVNYHCVLGC